MEQRIGRCHRYGQKNDVVAMNFLNLANAADMRVFELLDKKFKLFSGVFGASDEILGAIGSGVDFERRILEIYQSCRTEEEINTAFDELQAELSEEINQRILETRRKLLEHFDDEVRARFKVINSRMKEDLSTLDTMLARLVISALDVRDYRIEGGVCRMFIESTKAGGDKPRPYEMQQPIIGVGEAVEYPIAGVGEALVASRIGSGKNERQAREDILKLEKECSNITGKLAQEKRRLFEEKEKEAKRLEKKLKLKVQRACIAKAVWEMA